MPSWRKVIISGSDAALNSLSVTNGLTGSLLGTASFATQALTASYVAGASSFPYTGSAGISGSLNINGSISSSFLLVSSSANTLTTGPVMTIVGTGSGYPIFTIQGSQGELFSVSDSLTGSLFSVSDISGLPILEVFSDNTTTIGDYLAPMLVTTKKITQTNSGSFVVYSIPTSSYDGVFIDYTIKSGSNARAGTIMSTWAGTSIVFSEVDTTDIGNTSVVGLTMILSGSNAVMTGSSSTGIWTLKAVIRSI